MPLLLLSCNSVLNVEPKPQPLTVWQNASATRALPGDVLRVATLNIAHGRGQRLNQLLVSSAKIEQNLANIGQFLRDRDIHIAALQEVDAPSAWSGNIDQADSVARYAGYPRWVQASHASLWVARYGTAILSALPVTGAVGHDFPPSPPTAGKGFTLAEIEWHNGTGERISVDVISIHMDFSRESVRRQQLDILSRVMEKRHNPLILMGDFNSQTLAERLVENAMDGDRQLHTWTGGESKDFTYKKKRLDWIIISGELDFVDYTTADEPLSDHRAVIAELKMASP